MLKYASWRVVFDGAELFLDPAPKSIKVARGEATIFFIFINLHIAPCDLPGDLGHAPPRIFFKWCNFVRLGEYFDQILSYFFFNFRFL